MRAHITHQHQTATRQREFSAVGGGKRYIRLHLALDGFTVTSEGTLQRTAHQTEPVAVHLQLVFDIHGRNSILAIHDRTQGRLGENIVDVGVVTPANELSLAELDHQMQTVLAQQHRVWLFGVAGIANQSLRPQQTGTGAVTLGDDQMPTGDAIAHRMMMCALLQTKMTVQKVTHEANDFVATNGVVLSGALAAICLWYGIGGVKRVVERVPA